MDKTVQYTIITNKEYSFPNCINKLQASWEEDKTAKITERKEIIEVVICSPQHICKLRNLSLQKSCYLLC